MLDAGTRSGYSAASMTRIGASVTDIASDAFDTAVFRTSDGSAIDAVSVPGFTCSVSSIAGESGSKPVAVLVQEGAYAPAKPDGSERG